MIVAVAALAAWTTITFFSAERLIVEKPLLQADAIVVLAGAGTFVERTRMAALMYKRGIARRVLLTDDGVQSGWSQKEQRNPSYADLARSQLLAEDVPAYAIEILSPKVSGTITEATLLREKIAERHWRSLLIVTSAYHTSRALRTFENVFARKGMQTEIGIVAARTDQEALPTSYWWMTLKGWRDVGGEYVKSFYYCLIY